MEEFLIYQGKIALAIASFYIFYLIMFRHHKQFRFNRFYLTVSLCISFIIPVITITVSHPVIRQMVILSDTGNSVSATVSDSPAGFGFVRLFFYGYLGIVTLFLLHLFTGYMKAILIIKKCRESKVNGDRIYISREDIHPFTFFDKILVAGNTLTHPNLEMILNHEKIHAREKHTLDILFSEILFLFQWFNPFAWLLKVAIKNNLEFLTDEEVLHKAGMQEYQMAMVSLADKRGITPFLNALNGNDIKNRIIMMKKKTENRNKVTRQLAVLPLLVILILGLSNKEFKAAPALLSNPEGMNEIYGHNEETQSIAYTDTFQVRKKEVKVIGYGSGKNTGDSVKFRVLGDKIGNQPLFILDGKEIKSIDVISPDQIEKIEVFKNDSDVTRYGAKGKDGVIIITSKKASHPADDVLIILDGNETAKKVKDINPDDIQSVNVLKGESAISKYGEKGNKGVIEITMKHRTGNNTSTINSTQELRKYIASSILYPLEAQETGQQGAIRIYAYVNNDGKITQITESKPKADFITVDEVVIVAYTSKTDQEKIQKSATVLNEEAALRVKNLPDLDIPDYKNKWVAFQFKFILQ